MELDWKMEQSKKKFSVCLGKRVLESSENRIECILYENYFRISYLESKGFSTAAI